MKNFFRTVSLIVFSIAFFSCEKYVPEHPESWTRAADYYERSNSVVLNAYAEDELLTTVTADSYTTASPSYRFVYTTGSHITDLYRYSRLPITEDLIVFPQAEAIRIHDRKSESGCHIEMHMKDYDPSFTRFARPMTYEQEIFLANDNLQVLVPYHYLNGGESTKMLLINLSIESSAATGERKLKIDNTRITAVIENYSSLSVVGDNFIVNMADHAFTMDGSGEMVAILHRRTLDQVIARDGVHFAYSDRTGELFMSQNEGISWNLLSVQEHLQGKRFVEINSQLLAYEASKIYRVDEVNDQWELVELDTDGLSNKTITDLELVNDNLIATTYLGVYRIALDKIL
ncbi:MAG: hypothetical protein WBB45_09445 [Cyclobacteriaceae bacterium]